MGTNMLPTTRMENATENALREAIGNVLRRKRSEHLELSQKYNNGCRDKGGPVRGLGSEIESLRRQIKDLEEMAQELSA